MKEMPKKELGTGRIAFFARKEEIKKELETGRTVMSIYREMGPKMGIGYSQFDRYVNKLIRSKPDENQGKKRDRITNEPGNTDKETKKRSDGFEIDSDTGEKRRKSIV